MLTKERIGKTRKLKYAAVALALLAVLVFCFASCGKATPTGIEYVADSATKVVYNPGDVFDCTGAQVKVTYDNGATETVAVTPEMVGTAPLALGATSVGVTYSENGATIMSHIPVTVVDPNAALKEDTIAALAANEKYVANKNDGGAVLLLGDYSAKIKAAASKDAITALVSNFEADLTDYLADKAAVLAKFDAEELTTKIGKLYAQYKKDIDTAASTAKANVAAASTIAEAENYYLQFVVAVDNKLAEQNLIEDKDNGGNGQIQDKIKLLYQLEAYLERVKFFEGLVNAAYAKDGAGNLTGEAWALHNDVATAETFYANTLKEYTDIRSAIDYQQKYITLAIDLSSIDLDTVIGNPLLTEVDTAVSDYLVKGSIKVLPTAYKADGALDTENDTIAKLLKAVKDLFGEAEKKFGAAGVNKLKATYGVKNGENYIDLLIEEIEMRYETLNEVREDAAIIIEKIDAIANYQPTGATPADANTPADDHDAAIRAAWAELNNWNAMYNEMILTTTGEGQTVIGVTYDKSLEEVIYTAKGYDATGKKFNNITDTWTQYAFDETYIKTYFIPNIDELIEASQERFAARVKVAIANDKLTAKTETTEGNIYYSSTPDVNSKEEIDQARGLYDAFKLAYSDDVYNALFTEKTEDGNDYYLTRLEKAEADFAALVTKANTANAAINAYKELIGDDVRTIVVGDFNDNGGLKAAYDAYIAFAKANGAIANAESADRAAYTDVITNEARLVAYMEQYTEVVAFENAKDVESAKIIYTAWIDRDNIAKDDRNVPQTFRNDLQDFAEDMVAYIKANYDYVVPATVMVKEAPVTITANNEKFYFVEILNYNKNLIEQVAKDVADYIKGITYETDFSVNPLEPEYT